VRSQERELATCSAATCIIGSWVIFNVPEITTSDDLRSSDSDFAFTEI
jgi:hypothetical protein